jgi:glycosyltransferase involved in cell wall biosynthesis
VRLVVVVENDAPFVAEEVAALRALGADVAVVSVFRPSPLARWERRYAGPVVYPSSGRLGWTRWSASALGRPRASAALVRVARREGAPLRLVALAAALARRARAEGRSHVHASFATFPAWTAWAAASLARLPFSFTAHAYDVQAPRPWLPRLAARARFIRAISAETGRRVAALAPQAAERVRVGHLGVDVRRFRPGAARAEPPEIVCVAHLGPTKGVEVLVDAAAKLWAQGARFVVRVLGDGPLGVALGERVRARGLEGVVRLEGPASRFEVARALGRATVFALPCTVVDGWRHDGLPVALLEAMAAGCAAVSTPVGGIPEALEDGRNGSLVPPGDADALAGRIGELLGDRGRCARLGAEARATVLARFRADEAAQRLLGWIAAEPAARGAGAARAARREAQA